MDFEGYLNFDLRRPAYQSQFRVDDSRENKKATNQNTNFDEIKTIEDLKTKIENNDLVVSRADRGQSVTIIKKEEYIRKIDARISRN